MYTVLVTGDRNWNTAVQRRAVFDQLVNLQAYTTDGNVCIIHGAARGADTLAAQVARELGYDAVPYPAEWDKYGRAAGPIRNQQMLDEERINLVLAFHDDLVGSKGTKDMVKRALKAGIHVFHCQSDGKVVASFGGRLPGL
jgi:hypothetical protein